MFDPDQHRIIHPTELDFYVKWDEQHTFPFFETEDAGYIIGPQHQDAALFAAGVNEYDRVCDPNLAADEGYTADDVKHLWAIAFVQKDRPDDGWWVTWEDETVNAYSDLTVGVTVIYR